MAIFPGFILSRFADWARRDSDDSERITVDNHQGNGVYGVHQARVRLAGDPTIYRLVIAPHDAPISINSMPIGDHFAEPLGTQ